jgi:hypothetical protein
MSLESRKRYRVSQSEPPVPLLKQPVHDRGGGHRTHGANDQLFRLDDEEEHQAADEQPRPNPERDRLGLEQSLERRRVGKSPSRSFLSLPALSVIPTGARRYHSSTLLDGDAVLLPCGCRPYTYIRINAIISIIK